MIVDRIIVTPLILSAQYNVTYIMFLKVQGPSTSEELFAVEFHPTSKSFLSDSMIENPCKQVSFALGLVLKTPFGHFSVRQMKLL